MRSATRQLVTAFLVGVLVVSAAAWASSKVKPSRASAPPQYSGFLSDYSLLQADPADPTYLHYVAPSFNPAQYRKFILDTPQVIINTGGSYQSLDPATLADLSDYYKGVMAAALGQHYQVVTEPGPGVARLRVAVVGAVEVKPKLKPRDALPVTALFKLGRMAVGKNPYILRMSIESEALDSQTGAVLGETVDSRESKKTVTKGEPASSSQLHELIDFWVNRFVAKLDKANGFTH